MFLSWINRATLQTNENALQMPKAPGSDRDGAAHRTAGPQAMLISALTHWGFFWANTSVIYIAEIYDNYEPLGMVF